MSNLHILDNYELVVYAATPGGMGAAIAAARRNKKTLLIEPSKHMGGMMTSGLGRTDIRSLEASGSIFKEFATKVKEYYVQHYGEHSQQVEDCNQGLWFEPSVAKDIWLTLLTNESNITLCCNNELMDTHVADHALEQISIRSVENGQLFHIHAKVFIDASYEGDLAAMAGVPYTLGREARTEWNEEYAGKIYMDYHPNKTILPHSTGEGDNRVQAYNFRLCLTDDPANMVPVTKPDSYVRENYISLIEDIKKQRINDLGDIMKLERIPNHKTDTNNHHYCLCSTDLPEESDLFPEGGSEVRRQIINRHRNYTKGLLWFIQNDQAIPNRIREDAKKWGYAADEFIEFDHFPPQIYVREARRIKGEYVFSENDARLAPGLERAPIHVDSIAVGDYAIDSHATRKREEAGQDVTLEGFLGLTWLTEIYQIPYASMIPQNVDRLLVPVAISSTHLGFGTIRMEPFWLQIGFAAGISASISISQQKSVRDISIDVLQDALIEKDQKLTHYQDVTWDHPYRQAAEYFGTKGFFTSYTAKLDQPLLVSEASKWVMMARGLEGGSSIPVLPASANVLPVGVDMGPRSPREELSPSEYWQYNPVLKRNMAEQWLSVVNRLTNLRLRVSQTDRETVIRGEFCHWLYQILKANRSKFS